MLNYFDRFLRIKEKLMILTALVAVLSTAILSSITIFQYRRILLEKTNDVCENLSLNISRISKDELLLNDIYDDTRRTLSSLGDSQIRGLLQSYVVYRDGRIVAHTQKDRSGVNAAADLQAYLQSLSDLDPKQKQLDIREITAPGGMTVLRFAAPIFIHYQGERIYLGASVFEFDYDEVYGPVNEVQSIVLVASAVIIVLAVVVSYVMSRRISKPIEDLARAATSISRGELGVQVAVKSSDEVGELTRTFNTMSVNLRDMEQERATQAAMKREFEIAQGIQLSLLPGNGMHGPYEFFGYMRTADEVGGDYYDCIEVKGPRGSMYWFFIGDVSGHGLSAGLTMLMAQTAIHTAMDLMPKLEPDEAFAAVNRILYHNITKLKQHRYMTGCFYRADRSGNFTYSGLHLETMIYRAGRKQDIETLPTEGMWLGIEEDITGDLKRRKFKLNRNDLLFLYTDGVVEIMNRNHELYGDERLRHVLIQNGRRPLHDIEAAILESVEEFAGDSVLQDDLSFALVRRVR